MRRLCKTGKPKEHLLNAVLAAIVAAFEYIPGKSKPRLRPYVSKTSSFLALINVVNFYLDPANAEHKAQLVALSASKDPNANAVIAGYVREALRE